MKLHAFPYALFALLFVFSCSKKESEEPEPDTVGSTEITVSSAPQYQATVDGAAFSKIENGSTIVRGLTTTYDHPSLDTSVGNYISDLNNPGVGTYIRLERRGLVFTGSLPTNAAFKAFFNPGTYSYTTSGVSGIRISWFDDSFQEWSTDAGAADQAGSAFNITEIKEENTVDGYLVKFKATFNCKVYNGLGQSKVITNGIYVGYFGNI